jgi:hypothetical protein
MAAMINTSPASRVLRGLPSPEYGDRILVGRGCRFGAAVLVGMGDGRLVDGGCSLETGVNGDAGGGVGAAPGRVVETRV